MSSAFPPAEHNPHEWAVIGPRHEEFVNEQGNPVVHDVLPSPVPEQAEAEIELRGEPGPELELPDGGDPDDGDESEGGERPSASQEETAESAGTDSSESSSPARKSTTSGAKPTRKPARNAGNP